MPCFCCLGAWSHLCRPRPAAAAAALGCQFLQEQAKQEPVQQQAAVEQVQVQVQGQKQV